MNNWDLVLDWIFNWIIFRPDSMKKWIFKTDRRLLPHNDQHLSSFPTSGTRFPALGAKHANSNRFVSSEWDVDFVFIDAMFEPNQTVPQTWKGGPILTLESNQEMCFDTWELRPRTSTLAAVKNSINILALMARFYSTPSIEGVEFIRGNFVYVSVCLFWSSITKHRPVPPYTSPVPTNNNQCRPLPTKYNQVPISTA